MVDPIVMACAQCGKEFESINGRKTCSEECRKKRKAATNSRRKRGHGGLWTYEPCAICGEQYLRTSATQKYCSEKCMRVANKDRRYSKGVPSACAICGESFYKKSATAMTCSQTCAHKLRLRNIALNAMAGKYDKPQPPNSLPASAYTESAFATMHTGSMEFSSWLCPAMLPFDCAEYGHDIPKRKSQRRNAA